MNHELEGEWGKEGTTSKQKSKIWRHSLLLSERNENGWSEAVGNIKSRITELRKGEKNPSDESQSFPKGCEALLPQPFEAVML